LCRAKLTFLINGDEEEVPMPDSTPRPLAEIRKSIDEIDARIIDLLNQRIQLAIEVGLIKGNDGQPFFTPEREREIFESLANRNPGPLQTRQLASIFREIISASRAAEEPLRVAYWGPEGTFSHLAAIQVFGTSSELKACDSIADVFRAAESGAVQYGIAPVENTVGGIVPETLDMFPQTNVKICAESYLAVQHHLVSLATDLSQIERIYAGPQPFAQCRRWIRENLPGTEIVETVPTAAAVLAARADPNAAAIANSYAAELYEVPILRTRIEDNAHNRTRFLVVGFNEPARTGRDKTTLMFNLRNRPGELYRALGIFERAGVNLSMIESRPAQRSTFEYLFYCDCAGHRSDEAVSTLLQELKAVALETVWLGSYPTIDEKIIQSQA
jgi:chorismate mutase/prephenate dehydratase